MPKNVLELGSEIWAVGAGALVLIAFAFMIAIRHRPKETAAGKGFRSDDEAKAETVGPDEYIDTFAGVIEESGGGLPLLARWFIAGILAWYVAYLALYWVGR